MAKYNINNIENDEKFLQFIKDEYGYESFGDIPPFETTALLIKFRMREKDDFSLNEEVGKTLNPEALKANIKDEEAARIKEIYFGSKDAVLETEDRVFLAAVTHTIKENNQNIESIRIYKEAQKQGIKPNNNTNQNQTGLQAVNTGNAGNGGNGNNGGNNGTPPNTTDLAIRNPNDGNNNTLQVTEGNGGNEGNDGNNNENELDDLERIRSASSDMNDGFLDQVKLETLHDMGVINDADFNRGRQSVQDAIDVLNNIRELSANEVTSYENGVADKLLQDKEHFNIVPPKLLGQLYESKQQQMAAALQSDPNANVSGLQADIDQIQNRMDELTDMAVNKQELFYSDFTNIGDTYEGYVVMFDARKKYAQNTPQDQAVVAKMDQAKTQILDPVINDYDNLWNLNGLDANQAESLDKRYDAINNVLNGVELDQATMQMVSNFKFLDENGNIEPQFIDANGNLHDTYQQGDKVAPNSKLEATINITKQAYAMRNLNSNQTLDANMMQQDLGEMLTTETLYSYYIADRVNQGGIERPDQFTNPQLCQEFLNDLQNTAQPMKMSHAGYQVAQQTQVNNVLAVNDRIAQKIGRDKPVVVKAAENIAQYDPRAGGRITETGPNKQQMRKEMAKRIVKSGASVLLMGGALTAVGTVAASDASLTALTGGMNKLAGAAIGTALGVAAISRSIYKWRKDRKKAGQKAGWKEFFKEPRMVASLTTTALGAAALGFAATGNPGVATALGVGALTIGTAHGVVTDYKDCKAAGMSSLEAISWGTLHAGINIGAAYLGRAGTQAGIDYINDHYPDNHIFQHDETTRNWEVVGQSTEIDYAKLDQNSQGFLEGNWYKDNPDLLQQRIDALQAAGFENPHHALLIAHDSGMLAPDNQVMFDGTMSEGRHTVFGAGWAQENGVSMDDVNAMKHIFNSDGSVNTDALAAYEKMKLHVGENNFVTRIEDRPVIRELYGDRESSYDHKGMMPTKEVDEYGWVEHTQTVENDKFDGYGMVGTNPLKPHKKKTLRERLGSLKDRILRRKPQEKVLPPALENKKKEPLGLENKKKEPLGLENKKKEPLGLENKVQTPKGIENKKKEPLGLENKVQTPLGLENKTPEQKQPTATERKPIPRLIDKTKASVDNMLLEEYKVVYGIAPDEESMKKYAARVAAEKNAKNPDMTMKDFLIQRREELDKTIEVSTQSNNTSKTGVDVRRDYHLKSLMGERDKSHAVMEAREGLMKSNLTAENYNEKMTLSQFTTYTEDFWRKGNMQKHSRSDYNDPKHVIDLNTALFGNETKNNAGKSNQQANQMGRNNQNDGR